MNEGLEVQKIMKFAKRHSWRSIFQRDKLLIISIGLDGFMYRPFRRKQCQNCKTLKFQQFEVFLFSDHPPKLPKSSIIRASFHVYPLFQKKRRTYAGLINWLSNSIRKYILTRKDCSSTFVSPSNHFSHVRKKFRTVLLPQAIQIAEKRRTVHLPPHYR